MEYTKNTLHTPNTKHTMDGEDTLCTSVDLFNNELMPDYKNIKVHKSTHERLKSHGKMDESFDDLINRILDDWEEQDEEEDDK